MRHPDELTPDELATLRELWYAYPDGILQGHDRDQAKHDRLVDDGYIERTVYDEGVEYRLASEHAEPVGVVVQANAEQADLN